LDFTFAFFVNPTKTRLTEIANDFWQKGGWGNLKPHPNRQNRFHVHYHRRI
jgi:hypothetical protein